MLNVSKNKQKKKSEDNLNNWSGWDMSQLQVTISMKVVTKQTLNFVLDA